MKKQHIVAGGIAGASLCILGVVGMLSLTSPSEGEVLNAVTQSVNQFPPLLVQDGSRGCTPDYSSIDYNNDGKLSSVDLVKRQRVQLGRESPMPGKIYDINGDGNLTDADTIMFRNYIVGNISSFEICGDRIDNNCSGEIDEGCTDPAAICGNGKAEAGESCGEPGLSCPTTKFEQVPEDPKGGSDGRSDGGDR